ncbi:serine/threonine-protein phosphatase 7 long form homolog [Lolium perenne]|uniref:serine/threonine-protein phosphatase 7 long form homolog n=1 Tax=Lolium perenne TaxID=4522 RepID=UPI003A99E8AA
MTTNLAESYNFVLRGNRALPLTAIVEGIFMGTVKYYRERREKAQMHMVNRSATPYCSKIMEYMHKKKEKAKHLAVVQIGNVERRYEVRLPTDRFGCGNPQRTHDVKIGNEEWPTCECTCNKPKLLHLPCSHVLAVCGVLGMSEISFVSPYYLKEAVLNTWTEMAGRSLLNRDIERVHRAAKLEANPNSLSPMVTRGGNQNWQIHPGWVQRLKWAGLLPFARLVEATRSEVIGERVGTPIKRLQQDHSLLTSLVDRWRPETHTFHFRWGEMAPTLQDVSFLLGLPLAGQPIGPLAEPVLWDEEMRARFEGTRAGQTEFLCEDHGPKCDWLLNFEVSQFTPPMSEAQITRSLEAYILWLLGKVMFTENHQTTISRRFIPIALEIAEAQTADDIIQRSWGSAVLAATYRGLCNACTLVSPKSGILGCPLFLQLWSWERFPIGRPDIDAERPFGANELADPDHIDMPTFGILWTRRERRFARDQVRNCYPSFTEQFDVLDDRAVIWQPYMAAAVHERYPGGISNLCYRDCAYWMTQSKIIFDVSVEIMAQQRIMRQFGSRQLVDPPPPIAPLPAYVHK